MSVNALLPVQGNNLSDTLSTSVGASDLLLPVNNISIWSASGGKVIIDRGLSTQEIVATTGKSGSSLVVPASGRGQESTSAQGHNSGATVESVPFAGDYNNVVTALTNVVLATTGALDTTKVVDLTTSQILANKTLTSPTINSPTENTPTITTPTIKSWDGWITDSNTWTYASADAPTFTLTVNADVTGSIGVGDRIKLTQTTAKYFIVTAISYSNPNTTITIYGGTDYTLANAAITSPFYSHAKAPLGFPTSPAKWTVSLSDTSNRSQATPTASTWYNLGSLTISIPIGVWRVFYQLVLEGSKAATTTVDVFSTLSTANNSESDTSFTSYIFNVTASGTQDFGNHIYRESIITAAAKTSYFLNASTSQSSMSSLAFNGNRTPTIVRAVCTYL